MQYSTWGCTSVLYRCNSGLDSYCSIYDSKNSAGFVLWLEIMTRYFQTICSHNFQISLFMDNLKFCTIHIIATISIGPWNMQNFVCTYLHLITPTISWTSSIILAYNPILVLISAALCFRLNFSTWQWIFHVAEDRRRWAAITDEGICRGTPITPRHHGFRLIDFESSANLNSLFTMSSSKS